VQRKVKNGDYQLQLAVSNALWVFRRGRRPCLLMKVRDGISKECAGYMVLRERMYVKSRNADCIPAFLLRVLTGNIHTRDDGDDNADGDDNNQVPCFQPCSC